MTTARLCLRSANRSYELARLASDEAARAYWEGSARRWMSLFWKWSLATEEA